MVKHTPTHTSSPLNLFSQPPHSPYRITNYQPSAQPGWRAQFGLWPWLVTYQPQWKCSSINPKHGQIWVYRLDRRTLTLLIWYVKWKEKKSDSWQIGSVHWEYLCEPLFSAALLAYVLTRLFYRYSPPYVQLPLKYSVQTPLWPLLKHKQSAAAAARRHANVHSDNATKCVYRGHWLCVLACYHCLISAEHKVAAAEARCI